MLEGKAVAHLLCCLGIERHGQLLKVDGRGGPVGKGVIPLSLRNGKPLVATQECMRWAQGRGGTRGEERRMLYGGEDLEVRERGNHEKEDNSFYG